MVRETFLAAGILTAAGLAGSGCGKVESVIPPEDSTVDLTLFAGFDADIEKYRPVLDTYIGLSEDFIATAASNECFSWPTLEVKDACSVDMCDVDPAGWPSVGRAEHLAYPVLDVQAALLAPDWTEVFTSSFVAYEIDAETDRAAYEAGETHYYDRDYVAEVTAGVGNFSYFTKLQFRRIDDFDGQGHPAVLIRSWIPEGANSSNESLSMNVSYNFELLTPIDGGQGTMRSFVSWGDAALNGGDPSSLSGVLCLGYRNAFGEIEDWIEDVLYQE